MPEGWVNVFDAQAEAERELEPGPLSGGAGDEVTLRDNVTTWRNWRLRPRQLTGVEAAMARAAAAVGTVMCLSTLATATPTEVAVETETPSVAADAVLVGRPTAWGLAAAGAAGAGRVLRTLAEELEPALALLGLASPADLGPEHLRNALPTCVYSGREVSDSSVSPHP